ncbi:MAG: hypothetical protein D6758_10575 [Gammaproteobacteria bacterium]|nr:MAG: hypothetical protein D6758_10575 [Gammaproteobacteria bacterium]
MRSRILALLLAGLALTGCGAQGPADRFVVAVQGVIDSAISQDGQSAVIASVHHGGSLWDLNARGRKYNWNHAQGEYTTLRAVAISGDGSRALTIKDSDLVVWDARTGQALNFWRAPDKVLSATLSQSGHRALMGLQNNRAIYFDVDRGQTLYTFDHEAEVYGVALSADDRYALTGSDDFKGRLWRLDTGELVHTFAHRNQVKTVALSPDGKLALTTSQREDVVLWDTESGNARNRLAFTYKNFVSARFSEDGRQLLLGGFQGDVYLMDTNSGSELAHWQMQPKKVVGRSSKAIDSLAFNGSKVVAVTSDGQVQFFQK